MAAGDIIIPDVEVFEAGRWQGDTYTTADLDEIVHNYYQSRKFIEPPVKIGHEEAQPLLDNSGIPAVGYVVALRRRGQKLFADLTQLFPDIADLVEAGAYKKVSAELYPPDKPPEGVPGFKGWGLKAVSLLGGRLPYIKTLADLPKPIRRLSERLRRHSPRMVHLQNSRRVWHNTAARTVVCFSEVRAMAEDAVEQVASAAIMQQFPGLPADLIESFTPDQMQMIAAAIAPAAPEEGGGTQLQDTPSREQMIADLVALGEDQAALEAMTEEDLMRLWQEKAGKGTQMADTTATTATRTLTPEEEERQRQAQQRQPVKVTTTEQFSEADLERIVTRVANKIVAPLRQDVQRQRAVHQAREKEERHGLIRTFCERMVNEGKLRPADVEIGKDGKPIGPVAKALHAADAVRKFSDGKTALELVMESYDRPGASVRNFSEQVQDPLTQQAGQLVPERRDYLLGLTGAGKRVLSREQQSKDNARLFAEAMAGVMKQVSGNGRAG